jgi:hypothetical protein
MKMPTVLVAFATALTVTVAAEAFQHLTLKDLPPAVRRAVQAETAHAMIRAISMENKGGTTYYEVETRLNGRQRDLLFGADGTLTETEERVALAELPRPVVDSLRKEGRIRTVERLTRGADVTYEATVERNGRQREIQVRADGSMVHGK